LDLSNNLQRLLRVRQGGHPSVLLLVFETLAGTALSWESDRLGRTTGLASPFNDSFLEPVLLKGQCFQGFPLAASNFSAKSGGL
jgi:hypothetical protein